MFKEQEDFALEDFNNWLVSLPNDDFSEDFRDAISVRWDQDTGTWIEDESCE